MTVSIMITTKDRAEDLLRTCRILQKLDPPPLEILITADGCTDRTVEVVKEELPQARLIINAIGRGSVASRRRMMQDTHGDLVLALDDDSYPEQSDCLARIPPLFSENPRLAVVHFPQRTDEFPESLVKKDFGPAHPTRSFANSGAAISRSIYLKLPGFEADYFHAYEEPDYALQCMGAGYEVWLSPVVTIRHHYSGRGRNEVRVHQLHARNEFWSTLQRCPFPHLFLMIVYRVISQLRYAVTRGGYWVMREPQWWVKAFGGLPHFLKKRQPVSWQSYRAWLRLP